MPSLGELKNDNVVKLLYIGDSGSGKTGSLTSLVAAGYKLRILDFDRGIDTLAAYVRKECPDKIGNVGYVTLRDKMKTAPSGLYGGTVGPVIAGQPKAFTDGLKYMAEWEDKTIPSTWGPEYIFVLDSLSAYSRAAYAWAQGMNPAAKDPRQWYATAQKGVEDTIALLTSEEFHANVIVISHVNYKEIVEGVTKGYPNAVGTALGPILARYFNTLIMAESSGVGKNVKRKIKTVPTGIVDLKSPITFKLDAELPLETGMADLFRMLKEAV
jgi:hypothetical protein